LGLALGGEDVTLLEAFTSRERVNAALRQILDDATDKWGVRVVRVEIQRIDPPQDVMHAMHEQMKAERTRRAVVTEAEGAREAAVTRAEGEKASAILTAEGLKQRDILTAEGEAQATRTRAEAEQFEKEVVANGEAEAIRSVYTAINDSNTGDRVIAIKYLETLREMADGQATKIFVPADMSAALGSIGGIAEMLRADDGNGTTAAVPSAARTSVGPGNPRSATPRPGTPAVPRPRSDVEAPKPPRPEDLPPPPAPGG
ncbi:MAG: SPFH domain-containing protein, partial [Actinomycetota bacterium]